MHKKSLKNIRLDLDNDQLPVLYSFEDFKKWYLSHYDLSMFSGCDITALLIDEEPDSYPCIPLMLNSYESIFYLSTDNIVISAKVI